MSLSHTTIIIFRICLVVSLLLVVCIATIELKHPIMTSINDKLGHILAFIILAFLIDFSFPASRFNLLKILSLLGYGLVIEIIQYFLPHRMFSLLDMLADGGGVLLYILIIPLLRHAPILWLRWAAKPEAGASI